MGHLVLNPKQITWGNLCELS